MRSVKVKAVSWLHKLVLKKSRSYGETSYVFSVFAQLLSFICACITPRLVTMCKSGGKAVLAKRHSSTARKLGDWHWINELALVEVTAVHAMLKHF